MNGVVFDFVSQDYEPLNQPVGRSDLVDVLGDIIFLVAFDSFLQKSFADTLNNFVGDGTEVGQSHLVARKLNTGSQFVNCKFHKNKEEIVVRQLV